MRNFKNQGLSGNLDNGRQPASGRLTRSTGTELSCQCTIHPTVSESGEMPATVTGFVRDTVKLRRAGRPVVSR